MGLNQGQLFHFLQKKVNQCEYEGILCYTNDYITHISSAVIGMKCNNFQLSKAGKNTITLQDSTVSSLFNSTVSRTKETATYCVDDASTT